MYEAINYGFKLATGDIFTWINSDDLYYKNCLSKILKEIKKRNLNWVNCLSSSLRKKNILPILFHFIFLEVIFIMKDVIKVITGLFLKSRFYFQKNCILNVDKYLLNTSMQVIFIFGKTWQNMKNYNH